jgi:hypothetical protein
LETVQPVRVPPVAEGSSEARLFQCLLPRYHYLGHRNCAGENVKYLVRNGAGRPLACLLFGSAAWKAAARDRWIGWTCQQRRRHLGLVGDKTYYHSAVTPVIVAPGQEHAIPLRPEFITPQDGHTKQDCEIAAAKRWLEKNAARSAPLKATLLGDDLDSHQPFGRRTLLSDFHFIFVCKPDSPPRFTTGSTSGSGQSWAR